MSLKRPLLIFSIPTLVATIIFAAHHEHKPLYHTHFDDGGERWEPTDEKAWRVEEADGNKAYALFQQSKYSPPHRSPLNISLLKDEIVGDFVLTGDFRSTTRDYGHRSLCLFFGYQDPAHFYYVHFGKEMDDHANQIFIVDEAPRTKISTKTTEGTPWDDAWHSFKIERDVESGDIKVYFDNMEEPVMTAKDTTFKWGRIGLGSFDDEGQFDNIKLVGEEVEPSQVAKKK